MIGLTTEVIHQYSNNGETIEQVTISHVETDEIQVLNVDAVIVNHGLKSDFGPLRDWGWIWESSMSG